MQFRATTGKCASSFNSVDTSTNMHENNFNTSINLTKDESDLFEIFRQVAYANDSNIVVRVAGGWVRDKLLKLPNMKDDVDLALDTISGKDYAIALQHWVASHFTDLGINLVRIGIIQQNPDKSKHLETATAKVGKFSVDFVNLRTESYTETSRVPEISFGAAREDAYRRDLTINSLFFNIMTNEVEDYTGKGIYDLKHGIIRTPLPAFITLKDDPLRILRAVRFACRFNFDISDELIEASSNEIIHKTLQVKVSRERISKEVDLMFGSFNNVRAVAILYYFNLFSSIFPLKINHKIDFIKNENYNSFPGDVIFTQISESFIKYFHQKGMLTFLCSLYIIRSTQLLIPNSQVGTDNVYNCDTKMMFESLEKDEEKWKLFIYAALTIEGSNYMSNLVDKIRQMPLVEILTQHQIKLKTVYVAQIDRIHNGARLFHNLIEKCYNEYNQIIIENKKNHHTLIIPTEIICLSRLELGRIIRDVGQYYSYSLLLALGMKFSKIMQNKNIKNDNNSDFMESFISELSKICGIQSYGGKASILNNSINNYTYNIINNDNNKIYQFIQITDFLITSIIRMNLTNAWEISPPLCGRTVKQLIPGIKGKLIGEMLEFQIMWMLEHPHGSLDELKESLLAKYQSSL
eukprot:gene5712-7884_t